MVSVVICSLMNRADKEDLIKRCVDSLRGADEVIVHRVEPPAGFACSWNDAIKKATGDYMVLVGDSNVQVGGDLHDLAIPDTVTSPLINGAGHDYWGFVFCIPRTVYEKIGLYDPEYNNGCNWEDEDFRNKCLKEGIPLVSVGSINFEHRVGALTISSIPGFTEKQRLNREIYDRKWTRTQ